MQPTLALRFYASKWLFRLWIVAWVSVMAWGSFSLAQFPAGLAKDLELLAIQLLMVAGSATLGYFLALLVGIFALGGSQSGARNDQILPQLKALQIGQSFDSWCIRH